MSRVQVPSAAPLNSRALAMLRAREFERVSRARRKWRECAKPRRLHATSGVDEVGASHATREEVRASSEETVHHRLRRTHDDWAERANHVDEHGEAWCHGGAFEVVAPRDRHGDGWAPPKGL